MFTLFWVIVYVIFEIGGNVTVQTSPTMNGWSASLLFCMWLDIPKARS